MRQLEQGPSELADPEAESGADLVEPGQQEDLAVQLVRCTEVAQNAVEWGREHLRQVVSLCDELREVRSENDRLRSTLEERRRQVSDGARREDDLRADLTAERDRAAAAFLARSELERRLAGVEDRLRSATEKSDRLESELRSARSRLAEIEHEIAQKSTGVAGDIEAAHLRIEQLTVDLEWARNANARLRSLLNVFGLVDHLESRPGSD
jgi:chromosome segregation ATPase